MIQSSFSRLRLLSEKNEEHSFGERRLLIIGDFKERMTKTGLEIVDMLGLLKAIKLKGMVGGARPSVET